MTSGGGEGEGGGVEEREGTNGMARRGEDVGGSDTRRAGDVIKSGSGMGEGGNEEEPTGNEIIETKMEEIEAFLFYTYTRIF